MRILFVIDVSREAVECGMVRAACQAIQGVLYGGELEDGTRMEPCVPVGQLIGIVTYDTSIHFYDISVCICLCLCAFVINGADVACRSQREAQR